MAQVIGEEVDNEKGGGDEGNHSPAAAQLAQVLLIFPWTKSGIDFMAPVVWEGMVADNTSVLLLISSSLWLLGCAALAYGAYNPAFQKEGCLAAPLWTAAGACYMATLHSSLSSAGDDWWPGVALWSARLAAVAWLTAGVQWSSLELRLLAPTRRMEAINIALWALCGAGFLGSCVEPTLDGPSRWTWASSGLWWCVGVGMWTRHFVKGGAFIAKI